MKSTQIIYNDLIFKIDEYNNFSEELYKIWNKLEKENRLYPFQTYAWNKLWYEVIGKSEGIQLIIRVIKKDEKILALFPFCLKSNFF